MAGTLMWELPQLEISGVETPQVGYPTVRAGKDNLLESTWQHRIATRHPV